MLPPNRLPQMRGLVAPSLVEQFVGSSAKTLSPPWHFAVAMGPRLNASAEISEMSLTSVYAREYKQWLDTTFPGILPPKVRPSSLVGRMWQID